MNQITTLVVISIYVKGSSIFILVIIYILADYCADVVHVPVFSVFGAGFQPKMTTVPYIFLNFYDIFESTVRRQNLEILTEHKPCLESCN